MWKQRGLEARDRATVSPQEGRKEIYKAAEHFKEVVLHGALTYNLVRPTHLEHYLENWICRLGNAEQGKDARQRRPAVHPVARGQHPHVDHVYSVPSRQIARWNHIRNICEVVSCWFLCHTNCHTNCHTHTPNTNCRFFDVSMTSLAIANKFRFRIVFHRDRDASILLGLWDMIFCLIEGMRYRYGNVKERDV